MEERHENRGTEREAAVAAGGDPEAFARLVDRIRGRLGVWIALRLGPQLRARVAEEDVFQETLLEVYRRLPDFEDTGPGSFRRWLFVVAENRIRDLHKFHSRQRRDVARVQPRSREESTVLGLLAADGTSPSSAAHRAELVGRVVERIERLDEDVRAVVVARAIEERTFREIAERLGRPQTSVQALYARGLRQLQDELRPESRS